MTDFGGSPALSHWRGLSARPSVVSSCESGGRVPTQHRNGVERAGHGRVHQTYVRDESVAVELEAGDLPAVVDPDGVQRALADHLADPNLSDASEARGSLRRQVLRAIEKVEAAE